VARDLWGVMNGYADPKSKTETDGLVHLEGKPTAGCFVILCDHASNRVPAGFGSPGLSDADMQRHIAWDPGALPVARALARRLGCPLLYPDASRLLIDCNRPTGAQDSTTVLSEDTEIPGNLALDPAIRAHRVTGIYEAYHDAIDATLDQREAGGVGTALVAIHSFTPTYRGRPRPWHVGVLYDADRRLADRLVLLLDAETDLKVGENEPYGPWDGVYHTLSRHGEARGLPCVMIEIRNDLIADPDGQVNWAERLASALPAALKAIQ
jgi:predicted N-formylglutamate amidohydrolase